MPILPPSAWRASTRRERLDAPEQKPISTINVLSIDFDYWFAGEQSVWTSDEDLGDHCGRCFKCPDPMMYKRLRRPTVPDFNKVRFTPIDVLLAIPMRSKVWVAESHADIMSVIWRKVGMSRKAVVFDIDTHTDDGPIDIGGLFEVPGCPSWITFGRRGGAISEVVEVKDPNALPAMDLVFICKSSPYLLEEGDEPFFDFIHRIETDRKCRVVFTGWVRGQLRAQYLRHRSSGGIAPEENVGCAHG
jgi:hypothetical protein